MDSSQIDARTPLFVLKPSPQGDPGCISLDREELIGLGTVIELPLVGSDDPPLSPALRQIAVVAAELLELASGLGVKIDLEVVFGESYGAPLVRFTEGKDELYAALRVFEGLTEEQLADVVIPELYEVLNLSVLRYRADAMLTRGVVLGRSDFGL